MEEEYTTETHTTAHSFTTMHDIMVGQYAMEMHTTAHSQTTTLHN